VSIVCHSLELSQASHRRRQLVAIGTALLEGEDAPAKGRLYVYDVACVVPDPDGSSTTADDSTHHGPVKAGDPNENTTELPPRWRQKLALRLKLISSEEVRGAVTAMAPIGSEGLIGAVHGQKCIVRGLTEDNSFLPVAAIDLQSYVSVLKELPGSGLCILGDAVKGLWFAGYHVSASFIYWV
jgi:cleavage and polyadenylation specificity factor subunit 1